jgi:IS4 transposase
VGSLDDIPVYPGSYYVMDRGYLDFRRLYRLHQAGAFFVTRLKSNTCFYVSERRPVEQSTGLRCDQTIKLNLRWTPKTGQEGSLNLNPKNDPKHVQ